MPAFPSLLEVIRPTTFIEAPQLGERLGVTVVLASETFQRTGSFKFRAAYNLASQVPNRLIITASSGNFGQAMACACRMLGKSCTVVMPRNSAQVKIDAVRGYGAVVDLIDVNQISRSDRVGQLGRENPGAFLASAYDDPMVIDGNASLGDELAAAAPRFDCVLAPVGGGGLTSGLVTGLRRSGSAMEVIGVEPAGANDAARSLREGRLIRNQSEPVTLADGVRTLSLGEQNWAILKEGLSEIVEVSEGSIREAVKLLFGLANLKAEPTGALSVAGLLTNPERFAGRRVCCVISGGNVDPGLYADLLLH